MHKASLISKRTIHLAQEPQIALLIAKNVYFLAKSLDFTDVFLKEETEILSERTNINGHEIKLVDGKKLPYKPIYGQNPLKLESLKTSIEINLASGFIQTSKSQTNAFIIFV